MTDGPLDLLDGIRVIELGQYIPAPYAGLLLADLGAEVVKVEPPGGDPMRTLGPVDADGVSAAFKTLNSGKTGITLDLKTDRGRALLSELIGRADVLVESYRPGVLERLGFSREKLVALNRGLVHVALSGWGQTGPYRDRAGHDINYMALGGGLIASGPAALPALAHPPTADYASGQQAALAVVAALLRRSRRRPAQGAYLDVSLMETVLAWQAPSLNQALRGQPPERRQTLLSGGAACYQIYRTADNRFLSVGAIELKFWAGFCNTIALPELIPRQWEPMPQHALIATVADLIRQKPLADWWAMFQRVDCCVEPLWDWRELPEHPQLRHRGLVSTGDAEAPNLAQIAAPLLVDGRPPGRRPPLHEMDPEIALASWSRLSAVKEG